MLELRPTCENCRRALPPASDEAMICSYECTFCRTCAEEILGNVCPNCGGGFTPRPVRPASDWRGGNHLARHPAATEVTHRPVDEAAHRAFASAIRAIPPAER
jgi:uncharacterized protein